MKDNWILFHSRAPEFACFEIGAIRADGSEFHYPTFDVPGQSSWSPVLPFGDGRRVVLVSVDDEMTHLNRSRSRLWMYDIERETLQEMGTKELEDVKGRVGAREILVVGSGGVEQNIDLALCRRFKGRGMSWSRAGAQNLLKLRLLRYDRKDWKDYWRRRVN